MKERKQSFLERLTGTQPVTGDAPLSRAEPTEDITQRSWTPQVDESVGEEEEENLYTPEESAEGDEEDAEEEYEDSPEEGGDDDAGLAIDMYESDNELVIQSMIAGVMPENLHITITRDMVTIRGKRIPENIPEEHYGVRELYWGRFSREVPLPFEIDTEGAEAVEKYGLLVIRLPKLNTKRRQELKVKSI